MNKYQRGKIYRLVNAVNYDEYIGSTCLALSDRLASHKSVAKKASTRAYEALNEVGWEVVRIELIENFACQTGEELRRREQHYIDTLKPALNYNAAHHTHICEHGRIQHQCVPCGGVSICEHQKQRSTCKQCMGTEICPHVKRRQCCVECSPVPCDACGITLSKGTYYGHVKSAKHKAKVAAAAN